MIAVTEKIGSRSIGFRLFSFDYEHRCQRNIATPGCCSAITRAYAANVFRSTICIMIGALARLFLSSIGVRSKSSVAATGTRPRLYLGVDGFQNGRTIRWRSFNALSFSLRAVFLLLVFFLYFLAFSFARRACTMESAPEQTCRATNKNNSPIKNEYKWKYTESCGTE